MKLSAGYILSVFDSYLKENMEQHAVLKKLCNFEIKSELIHDNNVEIDKGLSVFAVLNNIIIRGFPTYSSYIFEHTLSNSNAHLYLKDNSKFIEYGLKDVSANDIFNNLSFTREITDHLRFNQTQEAESTFEGSLIQLLENKFGDWIHTILCQQVPFADISPESKEFIHQKVDYLIPFPAEIENLNGIIIEMDGSHHNRPGQADLDQRRDNEALKRGYATIRIRSSESSQSRNQKITSLTRFLNADIFDLFKNNHNQQHLSDELILNPLAWARLQLCIIKAILCNPDWLNDSTLHFAILERESYKSPMAIGDLKYWLSQFSVLTEDASHPSIEVKVFKDESEIENEDDYHAVIDISMRHRFFDTGYSIKPNRITIRNAPLYFGETRKVITGPHLDYKSFGVFENKKWETTNSDRVHSLTYFLRSLFRKKNFMSGQLPILNRSLQGLSVIGLLPTGGGKSLTYQLSSIMQPGVCMVIDPIISLMRDQVKGLKDHWIDACHFINSTIKSPEERTAIQKRIGNGEALFFFISPERLLINDFRRFLNTMTQDPEPVYFNYCVIDEAHCVSEWGHDFRTSYLSVAENGIRFCVTHPEFDNTVPIFALTATASYDVLMDIQRELSGNDMQFRIGEDAIVQPENFERKELTFKVVQISSPELANLTGFDLKREVSRIKNEHLERIVLNHGYQLHDQSGLIFCPHRSHYFGITDRFKNDGGSNGVLDRLYENIPELSQRMGFFMGSGDDGNEIQEFSIQNQDAFLDGKLNLLVATKAFGMGIDKDNIRFTVHFNYPSSIESFLQEAGRAGRDKKPSVCYLLYTRDDILEEDVEFDVNHYFHSRAYRGNAKEKAILNELLHKIYEPDRIYPLSIDIQKTFAVEAIVTTWKSRNGNRFVSVQESFQDRIGSIMIEGQNFPVYVDKEVLAGNSTYTVEEARQILNHLKGRLPAQGNANAAWDWLHTSSDPRPGIFDVLELPGTTHKKYSGELELSWENNIRERIINIQNFVKDSLRRAGRPERISKVDRLISSLIQGAGSALNFEDLMERISTRLSNNEFKYNLEEQAGKRDKRLKRSLGSTFQGLKDYYNQVRDKADTEKAIYRLRLLGVIDDYTVNYKERTFTLYLSKKKDGFYKRRLRNYLSQFYSEERVKKELKTANRVAADSLIERYLYYLVDFGYEQVAAKRARSITDMKEACKYGAEKQSSEFSEYLHLYLNSKYFREEYLVNGINESLSHKLDHGKLTDSALIWYYIELMERDGNSEVNNIKHLRGATSRMLNVSTDNPVLLVLSAYSIYFQEYNTQSLLSEAEENLISALNYYEQNENWDEKQLRSLFDRFVSTIRSKRPEIDDYYEFEFENFRLSAMIESLKNINNELSTINNHLLPHV